MRSICRDPDMPALSSVFLWLTKHPAFSEQYAKAREERAEAMFEEMFEIADDGTNDYVEKIRQDGSKDIAYDGEHVQRSRLRVDTRKWALSKMLPKKYGDKMEVEHSGGVNITITPTDADL